MKSDYGECFFSASHKGKFSAGWPECKIITMGELFSDLYEMSWLFVLRSDLLYKVKDTKNNNVQVGVPIPLKDKYTSSFKMESAGIH